MQVLRLVSLFAALVSAQSPVEREYFALRTELVPGQTGRDDYDNLWAGQIVIPKTSYIGLSGNELDAVFFWRNKSSVAPIQGQDFYDIFTQSSGEPLYYVDQTARYFEYAWGQYSTLVKADGSQSQENGTFYFNSTGLQWYNPNKEVEFQGWLVCNWFYGKTIFWRSGGAFFDYEKLPNCAEVNLKVIPFPHNGTDVNSTSQN